jgi:16S rRNA (uracil1498-N3)-methyltransferase
MVPRLYAPSMAPGDRVVTLSEEEAAHVRRVLRLKPGAAVRIFDGRGREVEARVASVDRAHVTAKVGDAVVPAGEWGVRLTLAQAVLKGDKLDDIVRDAVMMGVDAIQPVLTARTDVPAAAFTRGRRLDRWHRIAVASAKQCGRAVVPPVLAPCPLQDVLQAGRPETGVILVEPAAEPAGTGSWPPAPLSGSALLLVGPEGGWTEAEVDEALSAGFLAVSLGPRTLRADAAALVALSVLQHVWR